MNLSPETKAEKVERIAERISDIKGELIVVNPYRLAELLVEMAETE